MYIWSSTSSGWNLFWILPNGECDLYKICGSYSYCDMKTSPTCNCIRGFAPRNATAWALGDTFYECVRQSRLSCRRDGGALRIVTVPGLLIWISEMVARVVCFGRRARRYEELRCRRSRSVCQNRPL
ncbi:S-locus-specific glycoprotein [Cardamine amara subsp. amara]|uniref:S-locus-specific glycoprotein n=1 Tax=Cardamine amara subsp. amara TaxID=228776 RepID=A0ABD1AD66_CARAN